MHCWCLCLDTSRRSLLCGAIIVVCLNEQHAMQARCRIYIYVCTFRFADNSMHADWKNQLRDWNLRKTHGKTLSSEASACSYIQLQNNLKRSSTKKSWRQNIACIVLSRCVVNTQKNKEVITWLNGYILSIVWGAMTKFAGSSSQASFFQLHQAAADCRAPASGMPAPFLEVQKRTACQSFHIWLMGILCIYHRSFWNALCKKNRGS